MSQRRYITKARMSAIADELSERHRSILADVAKLSLISGRQIQQLYYPSTEAGRRLARIDLAHLADLEVLARLDRVIGGERAGSAGYVYALGVAGQRLSRPKTQRYRRPWTPQPNHLRHALAVSDLYVGLRALNDQHGWRLTVFDGEPACWRMFGGPGGRRLILKPDAYVSVESASYIDRMFIEMDCDTEALPRIIEKAKTYVRYCQSGREQARSEVFPWVLWVVPEKRRQQLIVEALAQLPAEHWQLFSVVTASTAGERIMSGGLVPTTNHEKEVMK